MAFILHEKENHVSTVTLNRPDAMNAFNYDTLLELERVVDTLMHDSSTYVVIFKGMGKAFSVGADLKERKTLSDADVRRNVFKIGDVFSKVASLPQPTIAAINGYAFGGGMELALACDFRVMVEGTTVGLTETSLAIIPGAGGTQRLPRVVGEAKALELILTAKRISSEEAYEIGLATTLASSDQFDQDVALFAGRMLKNGPIALRQAKLAIKAGMNTDLQTGLLLERKAYEVTIPTQDRLEALEAFSEKRAPVFQGE